MRVVPDRQQRGRPVLATQAHVERVHAGRERLPVALRGALGLLELLELGLEPVEVGGGLLVARVEVLLAGLLGGDRRLQRGELALGLGGPGSRGADRLVHPADLALRRLDTGGLGGDLTGEPGQALAAVGDGTGDAGEALLLRRVGLLDVGPLGDGGLERGGRVGDLDDQRLVLVQQLRRLATQLLGVAAGRPGPGVAGLVGEVLTQQAHPLGGQRPRGGEPLGEAGERIPAVLGLGELRAGGLGRRLELGDP